MGFVKVLATAKRDLADIHRYTVETWNAAQASRYLDGPQRAFKNLVDLPRIGTKVEPGTDVSVWHHEKHRIFYRSVEGGVEIGHALNHARQVDNMLRRWVGSEESPDTSEE